MSRSLTIAFDKYNTQNYQILGNDRLSITTQDQSFFDLLVENSIPLENGIDWYDDDGLELRKEDNYGEKLTFIPAHTLAKHMGNLDLHGFDIAILAFIKALEPSMKCVLWWS